MHRQSVLSTPGVAFLGVQSPAHEKITEQSPRQRALVSLAQIIVLGCMGVFIFAQIYAFSNHYNDGLRVSINEWWGVPHATALVNGGGAPPPKVVIGHAEMVRPTYSFLFYIIPIVVSALIVDWLRTRPVRRLSSTLFLRVAQVLRRKPAVAGKVSYWSYGEWIFLVGFLILGNVLAFSFGYNRRVDKFKLTAAKEKRTLQTDDYLEIAGITLGFNTIYNVAFLFLPATRNSAWLEFLNISYANAIKYHRWLGIATVVTAVVHCAVFYAKWVREGTWKEESLPCFDCPMDSEKGKTVWFNVFGELAGLCFLVIAFTSMPFIRRRFYNVFYYSHHLLFPAVILSVMHFGPNIWWILPAFGMYLFGRAISFSNGFTPVAIKEVTALSPSLVKVVFQRSNHIEGQFKVGQFLYLNVPAISKLQWHAFTVASSPSASPTTVTVLIKAVGDWTKQLAAHAKECKEKNILPTVYVDGFYGNSLELYEEYPTVCLIGGGIGVTPLLAILDDLTAKLANHEPPTQKIVFVFSFRELALFEEMAPTFARLRELDPLQHCISFHMTMTSTPTEEELNTKVRMLSVLEPTQYADNSVPHRPFGRPLASARDIRGFAFVGFFLFAFIWVVYLEFGKAGNKITRHNAKLWSLQQFTEAAVLLVSALVVIAAVLIERILLSRRSFVTTEVKDAPILESAKSRLEAATHAASMHRMSSMQIASFHRASLQMMQVQTYRDLLNEWNVPTGQRPAIGSILHDLFEQRKNEGDKKPIGVFSSGPEAMKQTAEMAIAQIDSSAFDFFEEQFEL